MRDSHDSFLQELHRLLSTHFSVSELRTLSSESAVVYDDLSGDNKSDKARALIASLGRQERLSEIIALARRERPELNWPDLPPGSRSGNTIRDSEARPAPVPTFNIGGSVKGAAVSLGGFQVIGGDTNVDMRETHVHKPEGDVQIGDQVEMSGDFRGAVVNVKSHLDHAQQTIRAAPHGDDSEKQALVRNLAALQAHLTQVPPPYAGAAAKLARSIEDLANQLQAETPDREMARISGKGVRKAAENLKEIMPAVLTMAVQIADRIIQLAG